MSVTVRLFISQDDDGSWRAEDPWDFNNNIQTKSFDALMKRLMAKTNKNKFEIEEVK